MQKNNYLLFVPVRERFLNKIKGNADNVIFDLEDSVPESEKKDALNKLVEFLQTAQYSNVYVRINRENAYHELSILSAYNVGFMLPKVDDVEEIIKYKDLLAGHGVIALIETPLGLINIKEICKCGLFEAIAFGAEDFTTATNMKNDNKLLVSIKLQLLMHARAYGLLVYDTPSFNIMNDVAFKEDVDYTVSLGFDGKLVVHPKHITYIQSVYNSKDKEYMQYIVSEYDKRGGGAILIDGHLYEKMHIDDMKKQLNIV